MPAFTGCGREHLTRGPLPRCLNHCEPSHGMEGGALRGDLCLGATLLHERAKKFPKRKRVRQGSAISPKLSAASLQGVFRKLNLEKSLLRAGHTRPSPDLRTTSLIQSGLTKHASSSIRAHKKSEVEH